MDRYRPKFGIIITLLVGAVFPIVGSVAVQLFIPQFRLVHEPLHSTMEAVGALTALLLALIVLSVMKYRKEATHYIWISSALIGMGILDGLHAVVHSGVSFVWLHSTATLVGGVLLAMVWLPARITQSHVATLSPKVLAIAVGTFGILSIAFPDALPVMVSQGRFTLTAVTINVLGGILFLVATGGFLVRYWTNRELNELLFANLALLFGSANMLFPFSELWEANWWFWHIVRLTAYFVALSFIFISFQREEKEIRKLNEDLENRIIERTRAKELSDALNDINAAISSTLDYDVIMQKAVVEAARGISSERGVILLREGDHWLVGYSYGFPQEVIGIMLTDSEAKHAVLAARIKKPVVINDTYSDERVNPELMKRFGIRSLLAVPLLVRNDVIGALCFCNHSAPVAFNEAQIDFANKLAASVSLALENARLYEAERNIADTLQEALTTVPERIAGVIYSYLYRSATEVAKIGGDFYDIFEIEHGKIGIVIGDVSGSGIEAAALTAVVKNTIKAHAYENGTPASVMAKTNDLIVRVTPASIFVTVFFGVLETDTGKLTYCSAGHPPAIVKRREAGVELLTEQSPMIGAFSGLSYQDGKEILKEGDILILYTDGVIEARSDDELFGAERLAVFIENLMPAPSKEIPQAIFNQVIDFSDGKLLDDVALLSISPGTS